MEVHLPSRSPSFTAAAPTMQVGQINWEQSRLLRWENKEMQRQVAHMLDRQRPLHRWEEEVEES